MLRKIEIANGRAWSLARDLTPEQLAEYRRRYDAETREADVALQKISDMLEEYGLLDSTILVITSDHGEACGEGGFVTHGLTDRGDREATMRVPLVFVLPPSYGVSPKALWNEASIADIAPTIYQTLGVDWKALATHTSVGNLGRSLTPEMGLARTQPIGSLELASRLRDVNEDAQKESLRLLRELGYIE